MLLEKCLQCGRKSGWRPFCFLFCTDIYFHEAEEEEEEEEEDEDEKSNRSVFMIFVIF